MPGEPSKEASGQIVPSSSAPGWQPDDPFLGSWALLSSPLWEARRLEFSLPRLACVLLCGLWAVAVWAFFGGAITRIAAVELACEERVGWAAALRHAWGKWVSDCAAPLLPLVGVMFASLPALCLGVLLREQYVGAWLAALLWPLALAGGLLAAILMLGLVFGWPLMWATIGTEGTDSFDALSRSYAYVFGRPLHYLFYAVVAAVLGVLGWVLVSNFAAGVVWATYWAASWGSGAANIGLLLGGEYGASGQFVGFWVGGVKLLAVGFRFGYFWAAAAAIYLLLRRDVDATELDEVFLDDDAGETTCGLPPQRTDEAGAPVIDDEGPEVAPDAPDVAHPARTACRRRAGWAQGGRWARRARDRRRAAEGRMRGYPERLSSPFGRGAGG